MVRGIPREEGDQGGQRKEGGGVPQPRSQGDGAHPRRLPSGYRNAEGEFYNPQNGYLWTTSNYGNGGQWVRHFALDYPSIYRGSFSLDRGFSVRCVKN